MNHVIGVDIGTQGTRTALFDQDGQTLASAFRPSHLRRPGPGCVEEDPEAQLHSVCETIAECMDRAAIPKASLAGLALAGQMAGLIGVDREGLALTPYDSWLDTRCAPFIKIMREEAGEEILRATGGPVGFNHGPKMLWWKHEHPARYEQIRAFVQANGYVALRLCGLPAEQAFLDHTFLHFSGFAENTASRWHSGLCATFQVDPRKLPRIVAPQERIGALTPTFAERCRLQAGTPVLAGCGDTQASFLASGATREGCCVDVAGTASVFAATTGRFQADCDRQTLYWARSVTPRLWHPYAYIQGGGMNLEWLRATIASATGRQPEALPLGALDELAAALAPDAQLPLFAPHLGGRACPSQPGLRGAWLDLEWHHGPGHLYASILESIALEYALYLAHLRRLCPDLPATALRVTGGGEKSPLWNQLKADALQLPVLQVAAPEGAARGAALLAAWGAGLGEDLHELSGKWVRTGTESLPRLEHAAHFRRRQERYEALLETLNAWSRK